MENRQSYPFAPLIAPFDTVVVAAGDFPRRQQTFDILRDASRIVCCDGAADELLAQGFEPQYIVGDLDSLSPTLRERFANILIHNSEQETNDLSKAIRFCVSHKWLKISILGASGKREDHTVANIALLFAFAEIAHVQMITDYGVFTPITGSTTLSGYAGQQVSIFASHDARLRSHGLKYPIDGALRQWWQGTLNEALGDSFDIELQAGAALVFRVFK